MEKFRQHAVIAVCCCLTAYSSSMTRCDYWRQTFMKDIAQNMNKVCSDFYQQWTALREDFKSDEAITKSPEGFANFFKRKWGNICMDLTESAPRCIDNLTKAENCDDTIIFPITILNAQQLQAMQKIVPAIFLPVMGNMTVSDAKRYVGLVSELLENICKNEQSWTAISTSKGWEATSQCMTKTFKVSRPMSTILSANFNLRTMFQGPVKSYEMARLQYELTTLMAVKWFNGGQPLSETSCSVFTDAVSNILRNLVAPSCEHFQNLLMGAFDTMTEKLCTQAR